MGLWFVPVVICGRGVENLIIISAVPLLSFPSLWANYFRREELVRKVLSESLRALNPADCCTRSEKQREGESELRKRLWGKKQRKITSLSFSCVPRNKNTHKCSLETRKKLKQARSGSVTLKCKLCGHAECILQSGRRIIYVVRDVHVYAALNF